MIETGLRRGHPHPGSRTRWHRLTYELSLLTIIALSGACLDQHDEGLQAVNSLQCSECHLSDYNSTENFGEEFQVPQHSTFNFPTNCGACHNQATFFPAFEGGHPERAFPISEAPHEFLCHECHDPDEPNEGGYPLDFRDAFCVGCHTGDHDLALMDPRHGGVPGYPNDSANQPVNFCLDPNCHPDGRLPNSLR